MKQIFLLVSFAIALCDTLCLGWCKANRSCTIYKGTLCFFWCSSNAAFSLFKSCSCFRCRSRVLQLKVPCVLSLDRKAVISQGMLKCLGSSLFLKSKWGIGYRLRYVLDTFSASSFIVVLSSLLGKELCFDISLLDVERFVSCLGQWSSALAALYFSLLTTISKNSSEEKEFKIVLFYVCSCVFSSMHIDAYCNIEATTSLIRQHIPGASLMQQNEEQLVYTLPFRDMDKFSGMTITAIQCWASMGKKSIELFVTHTIFRQVCYFSYRTSEVYNLAVQSDSNAKVSWQVVCLLSQSVTHFTGR